MFARICLLALSQATYASHLPHHAEIQDPGESLQATLDKISAFHSSGKLKDSLALENFIEHDLLPDFAFENMAESIAGPYTRFMTASNTADLVTQIKTSLRNILFAHLGSFNPDTSSVQIQKTRFTHAHQATVAVRISFQQRRPVILSFRMQQVDRQWKVADIRSNGTSLVLYYRARFIDQLRMYRKAALTPSTPSSPCRLQAQAEPCEL